MTTPLGTTVGTLSPSGTAVQGLELGGGREGPGGQQRRTLWTADELMRAAFPEPRWAVPGLVAEGVTVLAGPPKIGKSWLSLGLAVAVASGGVALGRIRVEGGAILYLALEDTPRRLQHRLGKILAGADAPGSLHLSTRCERLPAGGAEHISGWLDRHPGARMVIVDVFARVRGSVASGAAAYDADYAAVTTVKTIADHHGVAVLLVHHVRKASSDDFLTEISGTNGIAGAADSVHVLRRSRGKADGVLHVTGRDVDESEHAMSFDAERGHWSLLPGSASEHSLGDTRRTILAYLRKHGPAAPKQIAKATGISYENAKKACLRMADDGQLTTNGNGWYAVPREDVPGVPAVPAAAQTGDKTASETEDLPEDALLWGSDVEPDDGMVEF